MSIEFSLLPWGWQDSWDEEFRPQRAAGFIPGRIAEEHRERYVVFSAQGEQSAEISGRLRFTAASRLDFPVVGDWVALQPSAGTLAIIHALLPRRSLLLRKAAGQVTEAQALAANLDLLCIVSDLELDFNLRRVERYLTLARESRVRPVIVLNKADLNDQAGELAARTREVAGEAPVLTLSALEGTGIDRLEPYLTPGVTAAFVGSSGVGKSTLINRLLGEEKLTTGAVRASDGRGRHTTTSRQLLALPGGSTVIDTPGMREVQLWGSEESLEGAFSDLEELAAGCRFADCRHRDEPDCAVRRALEEGTLSRERFQSYRKLGRELHFLEMQKDIRLRLAEQARWKRLHRAGQENMRRKYGGK